MKRRRQRGTLVQVHVSDAWDEAMRTAASLLFFFFLLHSLLQTLSCGRACYCK
jgi:hypothetical protein